MASDPPMATPAKDGVRHRDPIVRDAVRVLLDFIPDKQPDEENSNSAAQCRLLAEIRATVRHEFGDAAGTEQFEEILARQELLVEEIQKRTRMLVGV